MKAVFHLRDWPIRWKMVALLIIASTLPLVIVALIELKNERNELIKGVTELLSARGDQVAGELDAFNLAYLQSAGRLAHLPDIVRYSQTPPADRDRLKSAVLAVFEVWQESDPAFRGIGILGPDGSVTVATERPLIGRNLAYHGYVQDSLRGATVISDLHFSGSEVGSVPTIAYLAPVKDAEGKAVGAVALWVKAAAFWKNLEAWNGKAGEGSFSVLFDRFGVRIAHSYSKDIVFHPGGVLDPSTVSGMVAEKRFGENTRELLEDPKLFPEQFDRARSPSSPGREVFRGFAPVNREWNYGVPRRLETVPWTLFYMIPEKSLEAPVAALTKRIVLLSMLIIVLAFVIGMLFAGGILGPIKALSGAAENLSRGELGSRAMVKAADELGHLGRSFNTMAERLEAMVRSEKQTNEKLQATVAACVSFAEKIGVGDLTARLRVDGDSVVGRLGVALNNMVEKLSELTIQTKESATILGTAAAQIQSVTAQVTSSAQEAATAVSETTTTVEEVKQTAQMASQKAKHVSETAQKASQTSQIGRKSVEGTIDGMNRIRDQMEAIAESIVRLSEQSQAIGEIIATINDLTEQSNLLAVNASIEAAKAGEQGKGFGVVAQEVKSLAEQSKKATAQVRTILMDIQKATGGAVMATEQGSKAVEAGVKQAQETGEAIRMLVDSITEASQAATQIAASAQQQLVGMDQVAVAMESIKLASTQNVAGTKQAESAAQNLHELGQKLKQLVERYKV
jgi:methyl-accepting chemotaxis protein